MKKLRNRLLTFTIIFAMLAPINVPTVEVQAKSTTVYTTCTGTKYHKKSCRTLKRSKVTYKTTKAKAKKNGFGACKVCKP